MPKVGLARYAVFCVISLGTAALIPPLSAQSSQSSTPQQNPIHWVEGPITGKLGDNAEIAVPKDFLFTDGDGARKFMDLLHNPPSNQEVGLIAPKSEQETWFVLFEFHPDGFVKDDEKSSLDSKAILESIQQGTEDENEERKKKGWAAFHVTDWYTEPFYDQQTHNVTWGTNGSEDNDVNPAINYSVRILGRRGTMNVDLVLDPKDMSRVEPVFKSIMASYHFTEGSRYADFMPGDKVAEFGLTALIAGGAGAVAVKTGLLAKFWKLIVALFAALWKFIVMIFVAIGAYFKRIWAKIKSMFSGGKNQEQEHPSPEPEALSSTSSLSSDQSLNVSAEESGKADHVGS
jgi:uncharacterized membrane-anchored protein